MKLVKIIIAAALVSALTLTGCGNKDKQNEEVTSGVPVEVVTAGNGDIETSYVYSGKVIPANEATVFSLVNGVVKKVNFQIGDTVNEGDILFEMDTESIETSLKGLEASLAAANANIKASQTNLDTVNGAQMQMQIENARITYENAKRAYENAKVMYDQGFVSEDDMKKAEDGYNQAKQAYDLTSKDIIEENTQRAQAALEAAKAQAAATSAQIEAMKKSLRDAKVSSPISGVVTGRNVEEGVVLSNASVPFTISDISSVIVKVSVSEQIINALTKGELVNVKISAASSSNFEGKIKTINPAANLSGTYDIEIEIINSAGNIKSGMFAEVSFSKEKGYNSIIVNRDAVITKNNETYVFIEKDGVGVKSAVVLGIDDGKTVQILKGLEKGDKVVVKGQSFINDGDLLNVVSIDGAGVNSSTEKGE